MTTSRTAAAAEALVLGQLLRRDIDAFPSYPGTKGFDLVAIGAHGAAVRVQVKGSSGGRKNPWIYVGLKTRDLFDVLVLVFTKPAEKYYVVPAAAVWEVYYSAPPGTTEHNGLQLHYLGNNDQYIDAWHHVTDLMAARAKLLAGQSACDL